MTIDLKPEQEARLTQLVERGLFASEQEALDAAIGLLPEGDAGDAEFPEGELTLVELFAQSPLKGLEIEFPRDRTPLRDVAW